MVNIFNLNSPLSYGPLKNSFLNASLSFFSATEDLVFNCSLHFEYVWVENVVSELTALQKMAFTCCWGLTKWTLESLFGRVLIWDAYGRSVCSLSPTTLRPFLLDTICVCRCVRGTSGRMSLKGIIVSHLMEISLKHQLEAVSLIKTRLYAVNRR